MTTIHDQLVAARARIDTPEKWCKGAFTSTGGACCALGAFGFTGWPSDYGIKDGMRGVAALFLHRHGCDWRQPSLADWNDAPERTHAEVMGAFQKAIALAKERGV